MGDTRNIKLTHEEIELIENALFSIYDRNLEVARQISKTLSETAKKELISSGNRYFDLAQKIKDREADV